MDTNELLSFMENDSSIKAMMGGVIPKDLLPAPTSKPKLFIVNLDKSNEKGSHWVALLLTNKYINEYFDPLGNLPDSYFREYFNFYSLYCLVNRKQCQSENTSSCGLFCLFYCYSRARGKSLQEIVTQFTTDLTQNEKFVNKFFYSI